MTKVNVIMRIWLVTSCLFIQGMILSLEQVPKVISQIFALQEGNENRKIDALLAGGFEVGLHCQYICHIWPC